MLAIEILEFCNFRCYFCKAKDITQPKFMSLDLFKRIIIEAKELGIKHIDMIPGKGEPFLHPDIYEMLDFANQHMTDIVIFTNASAINISKLRKVNLTHTRLCVSYYGSTVERFNELTDAGENLFKIVRRKLKLMDLAGIAYKLERRDYGYNFSFPGHKADNTKFNPKVKCEFHNMPKVFADGTVSFCKFVRDNNPNNDLLLYKNLNESSLKTALEDPLRYKFFDSQSICKDYCSSFTRDCSRSTVASLTLINNSKKQYQLTKDVTDKLYQEIENETIQRAKS